MGLVLKAFSLTGAMGSIGIRNAVAQDGRDASRTVPAANASKIDRGRIVGPVTDEVTGKPIAGATVGAVLIERRRRLVGAASAQVVSDVRGRFAITGLEPGVMDLNLMSAIPSCWP
jgi:hypothetical protein